MDLEKGVVIKDNIDKQEYLPIKRLMGCLAILGGHTERLRPGCRVELKISEEEDDHMIERGFCLSVNRSSGLCSVLFDNVKKPVTIEMKKVLPKSEMSPFGCIPVTPQLLSYFIPFTQPSHFDTRDPRKKESKTAAAEKKESEQASVKEKTKKGDKDKKKAKKDSSKANDSSKTEVEPPISLTWDCPMCTLVNSIDYTTCE
ncbi:hypothetical protein RFI_23477, partial [Reticulomyxa filosa]